MGEAVRTLIVVWLTAVPGCAQALGAESLDVTRARDGLQSSALESKAWGAFLAGRLHEPSLEKLLVGELREARELSHAPEYSAEYAYVQSLMDALIVSGTSVPGNVIRPFLSGRTAECIILLTHSESEEADLLAESRRFLETSEWLAVNSLLLKIHSGHFLADMIQGAKAQHGFEVTEHGEGYPPGGKAFAGQTPSIARRFPDRFPTHRRLSTRDGFLSREGGYG